MLGHPYGGLIQHQNGRVQQHTWAVVDVERTGLDEQAEPVEIAVVHLGVDGDAEWHWSTLVKPTGVLGATEVHGITDEEFVDAPSFAVVLPSSSFT